MFSLSWLGQNDLHPPRASQDNLIYYLISECSPVRLRITVDGAVYGCGGSIIDEKNILTAAHCQGHGNDFVESIIVYAGDHNSEKSDGESKLEVCGWTRHPEFLGRGKDKPSEAGPDIAILHLCEPLTFRKGKFDFFVI